MKPEARNKRITLMMPLANSDSHIPGGTLWAAWDVKPPKGRDIQVNNMEIAEQTRWINVAYNSSTKSITSSWAVRYGTKTNPDGTIVPQDYEIASPPIDFEMQHRELYIELKVLL
jgi:head-tail adaptor